MLDTNHTPGTADDQAEKFAIPSAAHRTSAPLPGRKEARLPFTVRVVDNDEALSRALKMRQAAYLRHVPEFARTMDQEEPYDRDPGGLVLLAESKLDRSPVGTMRIQSNCFRPLALEQSLDLPDWLSGRLVGATRLGVEAGEPGRMVKMGLFKALYLYCVREEIDWMAIAARTPLDRQYAALLFRDVFGEKEFIPLAHAANIPHRIMAFEVGTTEQRWSAARHSLYEFMLVTQHPDIDLSAAPSLNWSRTERSAGDPVRSSNAMQRSADALPA
ncbi:hypothetical protein [Paraburkholderia fungorum]|uniref:hypothetical protein n=1 Tax=Paraburkholderia fungorum TaxID=134537 RepID=UPI0038B78F98